MLKTIAIIFAVVLLAWLVISPIAWIYWRFNRKAETRAEKFRIPVLVGTFIALLVIIAEGIEHALVFIPWSWGSEDEYGEFVSTRERLGYLGGLAGAISIMWLVTQRESLKDENERMRHELEVKRLADEVRRLSLSARNSRRAELVRELAELREITHPVESTRRRISVLEDLIEVLERR